MATGATVAVVGATGAAGQTTLRILEERKFPVRELRCFASERSVGKTVTFAGDDVPVRRVEASAFKGVDIAICSAGSAQSREYAPMIAKAERSCAGYEAPASNMTLSSSKSPETGRPATVKSASVDSRMKLRSTSVPQRPLLASR